MASVCTLCDKRIASRAKVYGHFRHYHHLHFDQCVQMLLADCFVLDPTVSNAYSLGGLLGKTAEPGILALERESRISDNHPTVYRAGRPVIRKVS